MQIMFLRQTRLSIYQAGARHTRTFLQGEIVTVEITEVRYDEVRFTYIDGQSQTNNTDFAILQ